MMLFAALSFSIAASAGCNTSAFCKKYESVQIQVNKGQGYVIIDGTKCSFSKNPYANSQMCAPDKSWATCYEYCFSYDGKTYFFNSCE